ncbi:hypothetical protein FE257_006834 [Aspergillus nanangensis]|uniref:Zn(2)-C6 fungal-type domain-containing protein n=1 Tax=Aspergillus nanangensis TaxID=2582783 RepID=A0AAD4GUS0_ASPNN|nr:hypothetical protein FE257_006834 [Aspergillus nanangensis]
MLAESQNSSGGGDPPKLRAACENCRQSKVKCNLGGKNACIRCLRHGLPCRYRVANRSGKPKGSKNRATLRKLGQLQNDKSSSQESNSPPELKEKPIEPPSLTQELDPSPESYVRAPGGFFYHNMPSDRRQTRETSQPRLSHSPPSHETSTAINTGMLLTESTMEYAHSYGTPLPSAVPMGTPASLSPTFLQKEFIIKGITTYPLAVHIPDTLQATCECDEVLGFQMNRLRHIVLDTVRVRFDQALQAIRGALSVCQGFLQCASCHKENTNLLLSVSTLDLVLQMFDYWMSYEFAAHGSMDGETVGYGEYDLGPEETRQIRRLVLRGRLVQCKEVLGLLREAVEVSEGSEGLEGSWLQQIIRGYETSTEAFLQPLLGCICSS